MLTFPTSVAKYDKSLDTNIRVGTSLNEIK